MNLRYKIPLILLLVISAYAFCSYAVLRGLVLSGYLSLEKREGEKDILRCVESLQREIYHLDTITHDWAAWNDMYSFVRDPDESFVSSNLIPETFFDNRLDLVCIYDYEKKPVWGQVWDRNTGKQIDPAGFYPFPGKRVQAFLNADSPDSSVAGVLLTGRGPVLAASRPITTSDHKGPIRGYLIMGKFLDDGTVDSLKEQVKVLFQVIPLSHVSVLKKYGKILDRISPEQPIAFKIGCDDRINVFTVFPDISGRPALLFKASLSRDVVRQGASTLKFVLLSVFVSGFMVAGILLILLRRMVISPLTGLTRLVTAIRSSTESVPVLTGEPENEIDLLYKEFTEMINRINSAHFQLKIINEKLNREIWERKKIEGDLLEHQARLRKMSVELLLAEECERRRIATDVHDLIGQNLALVQIKLDTLAGESGQDNQTRELAGLSGLVEKIIQDTRSLVFNISPPVLYEMGLESAVRWLSDELIGQYGIPISIRSDNGSIPMETSVRVYAFRAVRELLHNSMKHSGATRVSVRIQLDAGKLRVEVSDNGRGCDLSDNDSGFNNKGFGLFSIRENLRAMGGTVHIVSKPGHGTDVILAVPLGNDSTQ